jgi:hypothetical protein
MSPVFKFSSSIDSVEGDTIVSWQEKIMQEREAPVRSNTRYFLTVGNCEK